MMPMADLHARPVDPRDTGWEVWNPAYRVYFWRRVSPTGWGSREFEVSGGDIAAVLEWATRNANDGETYTLFAIVEYGDERGLIRLTRHDPTRGDGVLR
jgi:hypothetical protein